MPKRPSSSQSPPLKLNFPINKLYGSARKFFEKTEDFLP
nr:MAG TPA: hypothetical protein [Caudoviricetes sp.]